MLLTREVVGEVELGGGAGLDADRRAVQLGGRGHAEVGADHEGLTVVVVDALEVEAEVGIARRKGPTVELPGTSTSTSPAASAVKRCLAGQRHELDRLGDQLRTAVAMARQRAIVRNLFPSCHFASGAGRALARPSFERTEARPRSLHLPRAVGFAADAIPAARPGDGKACRNKYGFLHC